MISPTWKKITDSKFEFGIIGWYENTAHPIFIRFEHGESIKWSVKGPRVCIGYRNDKGVMQPCPEHTVLTRKRTQCGPCSALDYFAECVRCNGSECNATPKRRGECKNKDYVVYIAVFANGTVKVGVSTKNRVKTRWVEQGADFAGVLAEVRDGMIARQIENTIGRHSGISTIVSRQQKVESLVGHLMLTDAEQLVRIATSRISLEMVRSTHIDLIDLSKYYRLEKLDTIPHPWRDRSHTDRFMIIGDIVSMKGSILITRNGSAFQFVDIKDLVAYTIEPDDTISVSTQTGLLDFFG